MIDSLTQDQYRFRDPLALDDKWEPLAFVNANPDEGYVLRILEAHLSNCNTGRWVGESPLVQQMNDWQEDRAKLLRQAIQKLQS